MITLSAQERERFAGWARQEARQTQDLVQQMAKLPNMEVPMKTYKMQALGLSIIAQYLTEAEEETS